MSQLSRGESLSYAPILTNETREDWENWANIYKVWMNIADYNAGIEPIEETGEDVNNNRTIAQGIWKFNNDKDANLLKAVTQDDELENDVLAPLWQVTPLATRRQAILFDAYSESVRRKALDLVLTEKRPTLSGFLMNHEIEERLQSNYTVTPTSIDYFPILAVNQDSSYTTGDVEGVIGIEFKWESLFENVLQEEQESNHVVQVVVDNSCEDVQATFSVRGAEVTYDSDRGPGDWHDPKYDAHVVSTTVKEFGAHHIAAQQHVPPPPGFDEYMNVKQVVDGGLACRYTVHFYPTNEFEQYFTTSRPALYTVGVLMIFVFTTIVFICYDCLVERRHFVVKDTAVKSSNIVNQMYPPQFVNRVIQPHEHTNNIMGQRASVVAGRLKPTLQSFLTASVDHDLLSSPSNKPIAELFPEVTILFADISGFTAWSSERQPIEVFQLLESLYAAFDEAARKLGVFKVETIGDCCKYMLLHCTYSEMLVRSFVDRRGLFQLDLT